MPLYIAVVALSALVAVVQIAFVRSLPAPFSGLELPLLVMTALAMRLRVGEAIVAALVAGSVADMVSSYPPGARTILSLAVAAVTVLLATRIFTHRSMPGTIGIACAAYLLQRGGEAGFRLARAMIEGVPYAAPDAPPVLMGLLLQLVAVLVVALVSRSVTRAVSKIFILH